MVGKQETESGLTTSGLPLSAMNLKTLNHPLESGSDVNSAVPFSAKIPFEKRNCPLMDFANRRRDCVGAYLLEIVSSVPDRYEFNFQSEAFISLRHVNGLVERNKVVLLSMREQ